jgi:Sulfatase
MRSLRYHRDADERRMNLVADHSATNPHIQPAPAADGRSRFDGIYPVLLGAYPVLFLWSQNLNETVPAEVLGPLLGMMALLAVATIIAGRIFHDVRRGALVVAPVALGLALYGHLVRILEGPVPTDTEDVESSASVAAAVGDGIGSSEVVVAVIVIAVVVVGVVLAMRLGSRRLGSVDRALLRLTAILLAVTLVPVVLHAPSPATAASTDPAINPRLPSATTATKRDVYWLIFDRYGSDRSLKLRYDIDETLTPWLREHGFTVLDDSHANYQSTALSLAATANLTPLEGLDGYVDDQSGDMRPVNAALQAPLVARQLQALGYRYHHIGSWWTPTTRDAGADVNYNFEDVSDFAATLMDSSAIPALSEIFGLAPDAPPRSVRHYEHGRYELDTLARLRDEPGPKYVFAHILLPHPPSVFDRRGGFSPKENGRKSVLDQFAYTNDRLRAILADLLALPADRRPIIILQGDEGPYTRPYNADLCCYDWSTATPDELEMKYGILNAWFLPGGEDIGLHPSMTAINTFPTLLSGYFGLDYARLPDRSYTSRDKAHPFDLTDITSRLPSLSTTPGASAAPE